MEKGSEVTFHITGVLGSYRGLIDELDPCGCPLIRVTQRRIPKAGMPDGQWVPETGWPILKDGDYILEVQP